jgi:prepilin-type N-terminal cleavage/methylation domain-containing protein/prepilin-type processing-associated H-X9-DG protein
MFKESNGLGAGRDGARGFSLVELLVVIAIVSVLAALMMPALSMARESGRDALCKSNMRQVGIAATVYRVDSGYYLARYISQWDSPLLESGGGGYLPSRFGSTGTSMMRNAGLIQVKGGAMYSSGITVSAQRRSAITLCPSGQYFGPTNAPGAMGYVITAQSLSGLDFQTRIQDGYEFNTANSDVQSYQFNGRFSVSMAMPGFVNAITFPVKKVVESIPPSEMLLASEYFTRDGGTHGYAPTMADLRGNTGYGTEPWPKYVYFRTPHGGDYTSGNFSAVDGHVANYKLRQLQAAWSAANVTLAAKELPFTF